MPKTTRVAYRCLKQQHAAEITAKKGTPRCDESQMDILTMLYEHTAKIGISSPPGNACRKCLIYGGEELWSMLMFPSLLC